MLDLTTRATALRILSSMESAGAYSSELLSKSSRDRGINLPLLQKLVKGTTQWRGKIDEIIVRLSPTEFSPNAKNILRLAAYQLLFFERVQRNQVIQESVGLIRSEGRREEQEEAKRLLRALARERASGAKPELAARSLESVKEIATQYSYPEWVVKHWIDQLGLKETLELCEANNRPWPITIRTNTLKSSTESVRKSLSRQMVKWSPSQFLSECTVIQSMPKGVRLQDIKGFNNGDFQVQDESAALVALLLDPKPGEFVIDLCAAPGGKATHIATIMQDRGKVLALDLHRSRLKMIKENCKRLGLESVQTVAGDATIYKSEQLADRILLDAPCSGLGTLGRKSEIRWSKDESTIRELAELQTKLIEHAATMLKPGGRLVYSTCTTEPAENEEIIKKFLEKHKDFSIVCPPSKFSKLTTKHGFLRTWPHRDRIGGSFAAILERRK